MNSKLLIAIDNGVSLSKSVYRYQIGDDDPVTGLKRLCSVTRQLTEATYQNFSGQYSDNSCLVHFGDEYWAVGDIARTETLSFSAGQAKLKDAIAKSLSLVGLVCSEMLGLGSTDIELSVGVLLPLDEWGDRQLLAEQLKQHLWRFEFNGQTIETILSETIHVSPEGYGICSTIPESEQVNGVLIMGHRDVTWAHVERGSIVPGNSETLAGWGMHRIIKNAEFVFKDELRAAKAIFAAAVTGKDSHLSKVASEADIPRLKEAIANAREQVWFDLQSRLESTTMLDAETIFASGGNSYFWRDELRESLGRRLNPGRTLLKEIKDSFPDCKGAEPYRVADVFAFFQAIGGAA